MIVSRTGTGLAISAVALALAASAPAKAGELWRGAAAGGDCRLELVNALGGVQLTTDATAASGATVRGDSTLKIEESTAARAPVLTVARADAPEDSLGGVPGDVAISVPPGCAVAVRTTHGAVSLEVGRVASSLVVDTVTGDITARVRPDTDAAVLFATSGRITTDFTVEIGYRYHADAWKHGRIVPDANSSIPTPETTVRLRSRGGAVRMLRPTREPPRPGPDSRHDE